MNAGEEASVIANQVKAGEGSYGYNAYSEEYGDMIAMGILDQPKLPVPLCSTRLPWLA